jgi:ethanolamine utilization microcompartment shell protein EutS
MKQMHCSLDFKEYPIPQKVLFGPGVYNGIGNNTKVFTNPSVLPADLQAANDDLIAKAQAAAGGDHGLKAAMHTSENAWELIYGNAALMVDIIAEGDESIIRLGGFQPTDSVIVALTNPVAATIKVLKANAAVGSFHVELGSMVHISGFLYILSTTAAVPVFANNQFMLSANPTVVAMIADTHRKVDFYNLPAGQTFYLSIVAFNTAGMGAVTQPVSIKVL